MNEWLEKMEVQINEMEERIEERACKDELAAFEIRLRRLDEEMQQKIEAANQVAQGAEKLATRLADDSLAGQEDIRQQIQQQEFRITEILTCIAQSDQEESQAKQDQKSASRLAKSGLTTPKNLKQSLIDKQWDNQLQAVEDRVTRRIADSV